MLFTPLTPHSIQAILISRFLVDLRQTVPQEETRLGESYTSRFSIPNFHVPTIASVIGNLGGPLDHVDSEDNLQSDDGVEIREERRGTCVHGSQNL